MEEANDEQMERAVRYLEGEMDASERSLFQQELEGDPSLQQDVAAARKTLLGLRALGEERLRASLREADADAGSKGLARNWWWAAAALLVLGLGLWWLQHETPQRLAEEFAIEEPGLPVLMGEGSRMDAIMNAYKQDDLDAGAKQIREALLVTPANDTLLYFSGIIASRQGENKRAVEHFAGVKTASVFFQRAQYQQGLALLQLGDAQAARRPIQAASNGPDVHMAARARDLLKRL